MPTPTDLLDRAEGTPLGKLAKRGVGAWLLSIFIAVITATQEVTELLLLPFTLFIKVGRNAITGFLIDPFKVIPPGIAATSEALLNLGQFSLLGLPISVGIVLITLVIVIGATALGITSNVVPGFVVDNPIWAFFFATPEEEEENDG